MNKLQKIKLLSELYGWKYLFLKTEDKLLGGDRAAAYGDERIVNADKSEYPRLLKALYKLYTGEDLNLDDPQSYNEKIQWLKIYDSTPLRTRLADKYLVRDWVAEKIGSQYLIPLLGVWDSFDEIDFDALPDQFVLKCNHGSGMNEVVKDKASMNKAALKQKFDKWMATDYSIWGLELQYRDIPRKIIAEQYIEQMDKGLLDYKIHVFHGEPKIVSVMGDRVFSQHTAKECFVTPDWQPIELMRQSFDQFETIPEKPLNYDEMLKIACCLGEQFRYVRVDLYNLEGRILFGEMTFTPVAGYGKWRSEEGFLVGSWIDLKGAS